MTFVLPVGPQHPMLKEPEYFRIEVKGEEIVDVDIHLGYYHRGIERALQDRNYLHDLYLIERICGICSTHLTTCYVQAVEQLLGVEVPDRARYIRTITAELERIHSHLLWAGIAAHEIGFVTLFMLLWKVREYVMDLLELISGNRVHHAINTLGGVRRDIKPTQVPKISRGLAKLEDAAKYYLNIFTSDRTVLARCEKIGVLTKQTARELCAVGPTARGSGIAVDIRKTDPYAIYEELPFDVITEREGDVLAKAVVRLREVLESIRIIRRALEVMPKGPLRTRVELKVPENETIARVEAPRGELLHYVMSDGTDKPWRVRIRTPTYANIPTIKPMLVGGTIAEIPIVVASIDPCFSCTDRVTVIDADTGNSRSLTKAQLKRWRS